MSDTVFFTFGPDRTDSEVEIRECDPTMATSSPYRIDPSEPPFFEPAHEIDLTGGVVERKTVEE